MLNKLQLRRKLRVEGLEARAMLAGDVTVAVDLAGNLSIKGDLERNLIQISEVALGEFEIANTDLVTPTTFNGGLAGPILATGVIGDVKVDLEQGNDTVQILEGADFPADLDIRTGHGNDMIGLFSDSTTPLPISIAGNLSVKAGQGDDIVVLRALAVAGSVEVDTSDGNDIVLFINDSSVVGNLDVRLGHGDDELGIGFFLDVSGNPVNSGTVSIGGHLQVNASVGNDAVTIQVAGTTAEIDTSDGSDVVGIFASTFSDLEVRLGYGDDLLGFVDSTVTGTADLNGSAGIDVFGDGGGNVFGTLITKKFEI